MARYVALARWRGQRSGCAVAEQRGVSIICFDRESADITQAALVADALGLSVRDEIRRQKKH